MDDGRDQLRGIIATVISFAIWGVVPIYWKSVDAIPPYEMIGHRIVWGLPFIALLLAATRGFGSVRRAFGDRRLLGGLAISAVLVGTNWFVFISAVVDGHVLEASLGYYINPLVNVLLGFVVLGERLRRMQWIAVALATLGVANLVVQAGELPWIALVLAFTFGLYGLVRKVVKIEALPGLFIEVLYMTPFAIAGLVFLHASGEAAYPGTSIGVKLLVPVAGLITTFPLWLFSYGARRLKLATVGLIQFLAPTGQFLLAVYLFNEPFTTAHGITFVLIWAGVLLYLYDLWRNAGRKRSVTDTLPE